MFTGTETLIPLVGDQTRAPTHDYVIGVSQMPDENTVQRQTINTLLTITKITVGVLNKRCNVLYVLYMTKEE